jgi:uracil DNA glycosylase superfamily protein
MFGDGADDLSELFSDADRRPILGPEGPLPDVYSGGCVDRPAMALVFVNPTYRNQSARERWDGDRAPFIGLRRVWRFLASCGLLPSEVVESLPRDGAWMRRDAAHLYRAVSDAGIYVTNLVKACSVDSEMPRPREAREWLPLLRAELDIVLPHTVVPMGAMVSSLVVGSPVRLADHADIQNSFDAGLQMSGHAAQVIPCYFPVGRGNPTSARSILSALSDYIATSRTTGGGYASHHRQRRGDAVHRPRLLTS